ncbi:hypothetical protein GCM10010404_14840 [Nonomuraea africana]
MQPVEVRRVERGVADDQVAESRHECIMRAFGPNNQLARRARVQQPNFWGISHCENRHTARRSRAQEVVATALTADSVAVARAAMDILHNQPELPGYARDGASTSCGLDRHARIPADRTCLRLTARANLSSDDLAVIRHALTAVAGVKVRA